MNTSKRPADAGEWRRQRTWQLHQQGWWQEDIAAALGVSRAAVCQWLRCAREGGGVEAGSRHCTADRTPATPASSRRSSGRRSPALLARGAEAYGFGGDVWTAKRIADVIWRAFGVRYHPDHVSRLLRQAGWSVQRPIQRATQRDEAAIRRWREERWPASKERQVRKGTRSSGETSRPSISSICCRTPSGRGRCEARRRCSA